jgi:hypothetical protein
VNKVFLVSCFLFACVAVASPTTDCHFLKLTKDCEALKNRKSEIPNNPWEVPKDIPAVRIAEVKKLFESVQKNLVDSILNGRKQSNISPAELSMIQRIQSTRFELQNSATTACAGVSPNAFYEPKNHSVSLCPQTFLVSESALVFTLGHELGHAIDVCRLRLDLVKNSKSDYSMDMSPVTIGDKKKETEAFKVESKAVKPHETPYKELLSCFHRERFIEAHTMDEVDQWSKQRARLEVQDLSTEDKVKPENSFTALATKQTKIIDDYSSCFSFSSGRYARELSADIWGARALGAHWKKNKPVDVGELGSTFPMFLKTLCSKFVPAPSGAASPTHPDSRLRINRIVLADKQIQEALGCQPIAGTCSLEASSSTPAPIETKSRR